MDFLLEIDRIGFDFINQTCSNAFFDWFLVPIRYELFWVPLYLFILLIVLFNKKHFHWISIITMFLTVGLSDLASSRIIKPTIERPRPCHEVSGIESINLRVRCGSGYSFTSSHATNHFALATIIYFLFSGFGKGRMKIIFIWAGLISLAQVYVGVHYPIDIICGSLLGISIGYLTYKAHNQFLIKYNQNHSYDTP